jgi:arsenate reductase (thioredoxin)
VDRSMAQISPAEFLGLGPSAGAGGMRRVIFVCTHNSARSQMAAALLNSGAGGRYEVRSAGTTAGELHPLAVEVMGELETDISGQRAKPVDLCRDERFDYVITVCDEARESCPTLQSGQHLHRNLSDPSRVGRSMEQKIAALREVRDRLSALVADCLAGAEK